MTMTRWEREAYDAALDGAAVAGEPCPACGDASTEGAGPCSEACERAMSPAEELSPSEEKRRADWEEIADELRGERFDAIAERVGY